MLVLCEPTAKMKTQTQNSTQNELGDPSPREEQVGTAADNIKHEPLPPFQERRMFWQDVAERDRRKTLEEAERVRLLHEEAGQKRLSSNFSMECGSVAPADEQGAGDRRSMEAPADEEGSDDRRSMEAVNLSISSTTASAFSEIYDQSPQPEDEQAKPIYISCCEPPPANLQMVKRSTVCEEQNGEALSPDSKDTNQPPQEFNYMSMTTHSHSSRVEVQGWMVEKCPQTHLHTQDQSATGPEQSACGHGQSDDATKTSTEPDCHSNTNKPDHASGHELHPSDHASDDASDRDELNPSGYAVGSLQNISSCTGDMIVDDREQDRKHSDEEAHDRVEECGDVESEGVMEVCSCQATLRSSIVCNTSGYTASNSSFTGSACDAELDAQVYIQIPPPAKKKHAFDEEETPAEIRSYWRQRVGKNDTCDAACEVNVVLGGCSPVDQINLSHVTLRSSINGASSSKSSARSSTLDVLLTANDVEGNQCIQGDLPAAMPARQSLVCPDHGVHTTDCGTDVQACGNWGHAMMRDNLAEGRDTNARGVARERGDGADNTCSARNGTSGGAMALDVVMRHECEEKKIEGKKIVGVGVQIRRISGLVTVTAILRSGPADGHLLVGDVIRRIDDQKVDPLSLKHVLQLLRGSVGSEVHVTVLRNAHENPSVAHVTMIREGLANPRASEKPNVASGHAGPSVAAAAGGSSHGWCGPEEVGSPEVPMAMHLDKYEILYPRMDHLVTACGALKGRPAQQLGDAAYVQSSAGDDVKPVASLYDKLLEHLMKKPSIDIPGQSSAVPNPAQGAFEQGRQPAVPPATEPSASRVRDAGRQAEKISVDRQGGQGVDKNKENVSSVQGSRGGKRARDADVWDGGVKRAPRATGTLALRRSNNPSTTVPTLATPQQTLNPMATKTASSKPFKTASSAVSKTAPSAVSKTRSGKGSRDDASMKSFGAIINERFGEGGVPLKW